MLIPSNCVLHTKKKDGTWENSNIEPNAAFKDGYVRYITKYMANTKHEKLPLQKTFKEWKK